jgi:hypothetical protein
VCRKQVKNHYINCTAALSAREMIGLQVIPYLECAIASLFVLDVRGFPLHAVTLYHEIVSPFGMVCWLAYAREVEGCWLHGILPLRR